MSQKKFVVDDETQIVRVVRSYLKIANSHIVAVSHRQEALFLARVEKPNLGVLDISMPKMDGLEFTCVSGLTFQGLYTYVDCVR